MSRLSSAVRRFFGRYRDILTDIRQDVIARIVSEIRTAGGLTSDAERRAIARRAIESFLNERYPHHEWLIDIVLDAVFDQVRNILKSRRPRIIP